MQRQKRESCRGLMRQQKENFRDCEAVGEGASEMRIHVGPGYRVYFARQGLQLYLLLIGGSKTSQKRDIKAALKMARELKE